MCVTVCLYESLESCLIACPRCVGKQPCVIKTDLEEKKTIYLINQ